MHKHKDIPVVILCGGMGSRLAEHTNLIPKPLVEIGHKPILWHIMKHYSRYGFNTFYLALGYKGEQIKRYFLEFYSLGQDFSVSLHNGQVKVLHHKHVEPWEVHLVDTGQTTYTGGRIKLLEPLIGRTTFMMTYGDGVSDVNLDKLLTFHTSTGGLVTLTAVRPPARFGALEFNGDRVCRFKEKTKLSEGWINGGFFVMEPQAFDYIQDDVFWEHDPMERLAGDGKLFAYKHEDFWQCMDTVRDLTYLESLWQTGSPPWKTW
ncbi:MAG TPA: glucose-1-phosphate cytidylyltransferase [Desulfomonilaceae bacterium]|nr:glucose-1-phosphate cytidylyltransferase [Desulfomonilaceae bacterium]